MGAAREAAPEQAQRERAARAQAELEEAQREQAEERVAERRAGLAAALRARPAKVVAVAPRVTPQGRAHRAPGLPLRARSAPDLAGAGYPQAPASMSPVCQAVSLIGGVAVAVDK